MNAPKPLTGDERAEAQIVLSRKLHLLIDTIATESGDEYTYPEIRKALEDRGFSLSRTSWHFMLTGTYRFPSNYDLLRALAEIFGVDAEYLVPGHTGVPERITAQLEAVRRMRAERVQSFAARTLGDVSPGAVEAIRKILDEDSSDEKG